jgi:hypothetical protein
LVVCTILSGDRPYNAVTGSLRLAQAAAHPPQDLMGLAMASGQAVHGITIS